MEFFVMSNEASADMSMDLGHPITKDIAEAHGGRIWFESRFGEESTICFTLAHG
ncbi:MAG: hypothetical protein N3G75_00725 [Methanothrix sp.]|nr:hypothetical protein [Methanothrix sp.]MCX8206344.1 hypothetical protein [Methanothrix sp.]